MRKTYFVLLVLALVTSLSFLAPLAFAEPTPPTTIPVPPPNLGLWALLARALQWLFNIVIILAAIMLVYAGLQYVTSNGDEKKVGTALHTLTYALIGVAVAVLAKSLIAVIGHFLGTNLGL